MEDSKAKAKREVKEMYQTVFWFLASTLLAVGMLVAFLLLKQSGIVGKLIDYLGEVALSTFGRICITLGIALAGYVLYLFKKKTQFFYGLVETSFALASCYVVAGNFQSSFAKHESVPFILFSGMTTVYLLVRGLSNVSDGEAKMLEKFNAEFKAARLREIEKREAEAKEMIEIVKNS